MGLFDYFNPRRKAADDRSAEMLASLLVMAWVVEVGDPVALEPEADTDLISRVIRSAAARAPVEDMMTASP